jgi:murein DD-endopeptidase MepM/ murein hydrolase activator NlpD
MTKPEIGLIEQGFDFKSYLITLTSNLSRNDPNLFHIPGIKVPFMAVNKASFFNSLHRLRRSALFRSPAHLLPATSILIVILLSLISFFLPASSPSGKYSTTQQLISSFRTVQEALGIHSEDEFGLKGDTDPVMIEHGDKGTGNMLQRRIVRNGETLAGILAGSGLSFRDAHELERQLNSSFRDNGFAPGKTCEIETDPNGNFISLSWLMGRTAILRLEKEQQTGELRAWKETLPYEAQLATLSGTVTTSLGGELSRMGGAAIADEVKKLLSSKVNLSANTLRGAAYRILYEKRLVGGETAGTGKVLAVEISAGKRRYNAYRFTDSMGGISYYDERGIALLDSPMYLQPCSFDHVSSGFGYRRHPISRLIRFHGGVDLAARVGTPVVSIADGNVVFRGRNGGAGNMVTIDHGDGMHTQYLHLSRFSNLCAFGKRVQQGDVIGYVGSTGSSTGPHLDFRVIMNGMLRNPIATLQAIAPKRRLTPAELGGLMAKIDLYEHNLDNSLFRVASVSQRPSVIL